MKQQQQVGNTPQYGPDTLKEGSGAMPQKVIIPIIAEEDEDEVND